MLIRVHPALSYFEVILRSMKGRGSFVVPFFKFMRKLTKKKIEHLDFEISFFEKILQENPDFTDALIPLGDDYTKRGLYEKGLKVDLKLSSLLSDDPVVHYNLACSYSLLGNLELALDTLEKAVKLGYRDFKHIAGDSDLDNIKKEIRYLQILKEYAPTIHKA